MTDEPIERAIDAAAAKQGNGSGPAVVPVAVPLMTEGVALPIDGGIRFSQLEEHVGSPRVLILDVNIGAWRPVLLPAGTWALRVEEDEPQPKIWTP